jgi:hypothetical protein
MLDDDSNSGSQKREINESKNIKTLFSRLVKYDRKKKKERRKKE